MLDEVPRTFGINFRDGLTTTSSAGEAYSLSGNKSIYESGSVVYEDKIGVDIFIMFFALVTCSIGYLFVRGSVRKPCNENCEKRKKNKVPESGGGSEGWRESKKIEKERVEVSQERRLKREVGLHHVCGVELVNVVNVRRKTGLPG